LFTKWNILELSQNDISVQNAMKSNSMRKIIFTLTIIHLFVSSAFSQEHYLKSYDFIQSMLKNDNPLDFVSAVFATENAFYDGELNIDELNQELDFLIQITNAISIPEIITYNKKDNDIVKKHASLFNVLTDSVYLNIDSLHTLVHFPYTYDFDDPFGQTDWSSMFVSKLLETGKGNCHSLPYLYKILADELGLPCYIAFAPNHIYIKLFSEQTGWYNTELTSATFPVDAWIMASGYITTDAIRNSLYMDTLSTKQTVANCLVDLAHGYQHKFGRENPDFVIKCCNTVLKYHPSNVNAMLTKAEAQKYYIDLLMKNQNIKNPEELFADTAIKEMYSDMEQTYVHLHQSGYRRMPEKMYFEWINLLKNEPNIYINKNIQTVP
jgi:hypothetical protein